MPKTPDRKPGPSIEEELQLETNASPSGLAGSIYYDGTSIRLRDAAGVYDPRTVGASSSADDTARALVWMGW